MMAPSPMNSWVQVRVPSDALAQVMTDAGGLGNVGDSSVARQDVTAEGIDLRARVAANEASVERLQGLIREAESVADLVAAESALAERESELESYRGQLEMLEDRVAMSTLTVSLASDEAPSANPGGFTDGVVAGWNGLVTSLNAVVVAAGFLLPWLAVIAVGGLVVFGIVRTRRSRRRRGVIGTSASAPELDD
jgi:hypothetical protein